jgi:hypothetical protein
LKRRGALPETAPLPSARLFAECILSGTRQRASLLSARKKTLGEEWALGKGPFCRVPKFNHSAKSFFAECLENPLGKPLALPSVGR